MKRGRVFPRILLGFSAWMMSRQIAEALRRNPKLRRQLGHWFEHQIVKPLRHAIRRQQLPKIDLPKMVRRFPRIVLPA